MNSTRYFVRSAVFLAALIAASANWASGQEGSPEQEKELLVVLRSDASPAEKALACKNLAIHGSAKSVPDLAKLLPNPRLSSWARIALEAIPGEASDEALRKAADSLEGRLLVGMINSIGVRRDVKAVDSLTSKLQDSNADVASAAAVALGRIGNDAATKSLRDALASAPANVRSAVAEGCVLCAERLHNAGKSVAATDIYDQVREADVPTQRIIEATRGAILARKQDGIPLLIETLKSENKKFFQLALGTVREFPSGDIDKALAAEVASATPQRAALLIQAMADRPDSVVLAAVLRAAERGDKQVRLSAIDALQRVGDDSCLSALLKIAIGSDADLATAAQQTLAVLPGKHVDGEIGVLLPSATGDRYRILLQLVGQRRIELVEEVEKALDHADKSVRSAALVALGQTVSLNKLSVLVSQVVRPRHPEDAPVARQALKAASVRMPDREACAAELATALARAPAATKSTLLEILSDVGGTKALQTLATAAKNKDDRLQDTSSRLLGKWNSVAAAPVLLDLAKTGPAEKYRVRALRGYIGLARKFSMPDKERAEMCQNAFDATSRTAERKLVLDVLKLHPSAAGLKIAIGATKIPALKSDANATVLVIAQKVAGKGVDVSKLLSGVGLDKVKLEIVKAEYGAGSTQKDVTAVLRKHAGSLPLITLQSASYNASFGGDPVPGVVKNLKVQYRINGKAGEASFAENALIILPMPK
jgi:HEAT repeat protein